MRNRYLERFDSIVKIKIEGKNIHNYLKRMMKRHIQIIKLVPISYREVHVILKYSEYQKLLKYKSIYQITILQSMGNLKTKEMVKKNYVLFLFMVLGIFLLVLLSRVIFSIEVIHQDKEIRELLVEELAKYNIKKYTLKKSYQELEEIEDKILEENKDRLEWIEIIETGTNYTVRVEERKLNEGKTSFQYQNIVSKKNAVLVEINAIQGEKVKAIHDYVKKGDTIIAGYITMPNNTKVPTMAKGEVYGEVWYLVNVDYPFVYQESILTGRSKTVYALHFFQKRVSLFDFSEYRSFQSKDKILLSSNLLNIRFVKEKQYEMIVKDEVYTEDIVKKKAIDYISSKLMKDNPDIREIKDVKIMSSSSDEDSVRFKLFVSAIENIGEVVKIEEEQLNEEAKMNNNSSNG